MNEKTLKGKTAVVTGGSRGIGKAVSLKLASYGANIAVIYAGNEEAANEIVKKIKNEYKVEAKAYRLDVSDFNACKETVAEIKNDFGSVHILINNAGITRDGLLAMMKENDYDAVLDTNLNRCHCCCICRSYRTYQIGCKGTCAQRYQM